MRDAGIDWLSCCIAIGVDLPPLREDVVAKAVGSDGCQQGDCGLPSRTHREPVPAARVCS